MSDENQFFNPNEMPNEDSPLEDDGESEDFDSPFQQPPFPKEDNEEGEGETDEDSEEEGEDEGEGEDDDDGAFVEPPNDELFQPKKSPKKSVTEAPPTNLGFHVDQTIEDENPEEIVENFGFGRHASKGRSLKSVDDLTEQNEFSKNFSEPPKKFTQPKNYQTQPSNTKETPFGVNSQPVNEFGNLGVNNQKTRQRGNNVGYNTSKPETLPRPSYQTFNPMVLQPNTDPLFARTVKAQNVKMDHAQSSSEFIRSTIHYAPNSPTMLKKFGLPFGVCLQPFAPNIDVPTVSLGFTEVIRCFNCRCYINPFVTFMDRGHKWKCNICKTNNDVPKCYYSKLDDNGCRIDIKRRKELRHGSIEFIAPRRYNTRLTHHPISFVYVIDVSDQSVASGALKVICESILSSLKKLPSGVRTKIGIITFDKSIHFYSLNPKLKDPKMMVVGELLESLLPVPKYLLSTLLDSRKLIEKVLKLIPTKIFQKNETTESAYFSALNSAKRLICHNGGKIVSFVSNLPRIGKTPLKNRDSPNVYGTEKETPFLKPVDSLYKEMALDLTKDTVSVDVFCLSPQYIDVSTLSALAKYTSGNVRHYPDFSLTKDGPTLKEDILKSTCGVCGFDGIMRIRVSDGLRIKAFYGNFFIKGYDLLSLPVLDEEKGFAVELDHDGSFISTQNCSIQAAVLYTNPDGERRIRVHNVTLPITSELGELYRHADVYAMVDVLSKKIADDISRKGVILQRKLMFDTVVKCLNVYRTEVRDNSMQPYNQLFLADNVRMLPLLLLGAFKNKFLRETGVNFDARANAINTVLTTPTRKFMLMLHPKFLNVVNSFKKGNNDLRLLPLTKNVIAKSGIYLLNNSMKIFIFIGNDFSSNKDLMDDIQGMATYLNMNRYLKKDQRVGKNLITQKAFEIIKMERKDMGFIAVEVLNFKSKRERLTDFSSWLIEDSFGDSIYSNSYDRHLVNLHNHVVKK